MLLDKQEELFNPRTNKTYTFLKTADDTDGEYILMRCVARAQGRPSLGLIHRHPSQTEIINVRSGSMMAVVKGKKVRYSAGEMLVIRPGEAHRWWNAESYEPLEATIEIRPALRSGEMYRAFCAFAGERKSQIITRRLLHFISLNRRFEDIFVIAGKSGRLKRTCIRLMGSAVKLTGVFYNLLEEVIHLKNKQVVGK